MPVSRLFLSSSKSISPSLFTSLCFISPGNNPYFAASLAPEYRWSTRFIFLDAHEAEAELNKYRKKWKQKVRGIWDQVFKTSKGTVNTDALSMTHQVESAINDVNSGEVAYGYYTSTLIFMGDDLAKLEEVAKDVANKLKAIGFPSRVETINAMEAYFGSLPGHSQENVRRPMLNTLNLSHLLPTSSIWAGKKFSPCPFYPDSSPALMHCATHGNTPFRFNFHVGDLGHALVLGPPGAGKSTFLGLAASQFRRYENATIFAFDKGRSMLPLCKGVGGNHFDVASETATLAFSPLDNVHTIQDSAWFQDWIETMLQLQGIAPTPAQRSLINEAVKSCLDTGSKTLSDLQVAIQDREIKEALEPYCLGGAFGHLLDSDKDGMPDTYEEKYGLNPNDASDANEDKNKDGYTNIEDYINGNNRCTASRNCTQASVGYIFFKRSTTPHPYISSTNNDKTISCFTTINSRGNNACT